MSKRAYEVLFFVYVIGILLSVIFAFSYGFDKEYTLMGVSIAYGIIITLQLLYFRSINNAVDECTNEIDELKEEIKKLKENK